MILINSIPSFDLFQFPFHQGDDNHRLLDLAIDGTKSFCFYEIMLKRRFKEDTVVRDLSLLYDSSKGNSEENVKQTKSVQCLPRRTKQCLFVLLDFTNTNFV